MRYLYLDEGIFCRVRRLAWCNDPESYTGCSVATGRATLAGQIRGEHPDKERYTGPPGRGLGRWASIPTTESSEMLMNYSTWNVHSRKMAEITSELGKLKMDVIGLIETKRKGTRSEIVGGYVHLYSGV